jgi:hypothetical protein
MGKCKDCKWWNFLEAIEVKTRDNEEPYRYDIGDCRRHPPVFAGLLRDECDMEWSRGIWPDIHDNDWCGEFKSKEKSCER